MKISELADILLSSKHSIAEKAKLFDDHLQWNDAFARNMKLSVHQMRKTAMSELYESLPNKNEKTRQQLDIVLDEIINYYVKQRKASDKKSKAIAMTLHSLEQNTPIIIKNNNREDVVRFIELKRNRFICEYPDGRRYSMPINFFIKQHKGKISSQLPQMEREKRDIVRGLGSSRYFESAKEVILKQGLNIVNILLDELAAAIERIDNAPTGLSRGVLSSCLGNVKKINPCDLALTKRIPQILTEIAKKEGKNKVFKQIERYPCDKVKNYCKKVFCKIQ